MFQVSEEVFRVKCSSFGGTNDLQEGWRTELVIIGATVENHIIQLCVSGVLDCTVRVYQSHGGMFDAPAPAPGVLRKTWGVWRKTLVGFHGVVGKASLPATFLVGKSGPTLIVLETCLTMWFSMFFVYWGAPKSSNLFQNRETNGDLAYSDFENHPWVGMDTNRWHR